MAGRLVDTAGLVDPGDDLTMALIGAVAVTPDFVANGTPSLLLAQLVEGRGPLHVVCETIKLVADVAAVPGYDLVPMALVAGLATEDGVLSPPEGARRVRAVPPAVP